MARNIKAAGSPPPNTERGVISFSSFQERPNGRSRRLADAGAPATEPRRMIMLAEQAHQADEIEQAKRLIEKVYAIYDQCIPVADGVATQGNSALRPAQKNSAGAIGCGTAPAAHPSCNLPTDHP